MAKLRDFYGNPLRDGLYFAGDGLDGDFYFIKVNRDGKKLLAESLEGFVPIEDFKLFAKSLIPLANPRHNLEFAITRILNNQ
ncbi:MAG: hypothetical protein AABY15_07980 [Nanoarchaeota archaeon]